MDTSETYIKMCEKADEIQTLHREVRHENTGKWKSGDFWTTVFDCDRSRAFVVPDYLDAWADEPHYLHHPSEVIWLPRQDQLQEMVRLDAITLTQLLADYVIGHKLDPAKLPQPSMEQLWLAFVMQEKYNKVWNGEEWQFVAPQAVR